MSKIKLRMEMEDNIINDSTDLISQFPDFIIHHIMSFLDSPKDRVRISVLSKTWFALTASFPILDFDIWKFNEVLNAYDQCGRLRYLFYKYVKYTTSRFCQQTAITAHTFKLKGVPQLDTEIGLVDRCLGFMYKKGVRVLVIDFYPTSPLYATYCLSNEFLSASSLTSLTLRCCELSPSLILSPVKFKSLKLLCLEYLNLDEKMIKYLTTNCTLLEELIVKFCYGFKRFCVYGHQNLQKVEIFSGSETVDMELPRSYVFIRNLKSEAPHMELASCKKLTTLTYYTYCSLKSEVFSNILPDVSFIQNLTLSLPYDCKILKFSSSSLRKLVLRRTFGLEMIDISTPNLLLFEYDVPENLPALVLRESLQPKAQIAFYSQDYVDSLWFQKLKQFLDTQYSFKVLKLHLSFKNFLDVEELKLIQSPPNEVEHIELKVIGICRLSVYEAVVDAVLWCCCPRSLKLTMFKTINAEEQNQVVTHTYEKLLQQEDEGQIIIRIVLSSTSSKAENHFSDLNSLLKALPCVEEEHITFIKEKGYSINRF